MVKGNIIERIHNIAYKKFDEVFSIKDIVHGEDIINIKAWVKKKINWDGNLLRGYTLMEQISCTCLKVLFLY